MVTGCMEPAHIKNMIAVRFADPQAAMDLRELLVAVAEREGATPKDAELARGASFIYSYIEQVPYMLTVAWTSARSVGLETEIESILEMVESYWIEDNDVILEKASRVKFRGAPSVTTRLSSMRIPPYGANASTFSHTIAVASPFLRHLRNNDAMK